MTAKEKANELESWYWHKLYQIHRRVTPTELAEQAKECALICVDEKIETLLPYAGLLDIKKAIKELEEVKQEINKL